MPTSVLYWGAHNWVQHCRCHLTCLQNKTSSPIIACIREPGCGSCVCPGEKLITTTVPTSARPSAWGQAGRLARCSMAKGTLEPRKGQHPQPGPAQGWSCGHWEEAGNKHGLCSSSRQLPCGHMAPADVSPSPSLTPTPKHVPGRIYCCRSLINAKSVCDGWAGSSSQDALRSSSSYCPQEQQ